MTCSAAPRSAPVGLRPERSPLPPSLPPLPPALLFAGLLFLPCRAHDHPFNPPTIITRSSRFCIRSCRIITIIDRLEAGNIRTKSGREIRIFEKERGEIIYFSFSFFFFIQQVDRKDQDQEESVEIRSLVHLVRSLVTDSRGCNVVRKVKVFSVIEHRGLDRKRITRTRCIRGCIQEFS